MPKYNVTITEEIISTVVVEAESAEEAEEMAIEAQIAGDVDVEFRAVTERSAKATEEKGS